MLSLSHWGLSQFYNQMFALDSAVVNEKTCQARVKASLLIQCITTDKQSNINKISGNKENGSQLTDSQS